jgi:hypothetical protein
MDKVFNQKLAITLKQFNMKTKLTFIFFIGLIGLSACNKETSEKNETADQRTLVELAEEPNTDSDNFLINGDRIDNTEIYNRYVFNQQDRAIIWRPFPSGWGWGCVGCFGLCNVDNPFPFPFPGEPVPFPFIWESIEHSSVGGIIDSPEGLKLQLYPKPEELSCAITEDGFFPIEYVVPMSEEMCAIMELPSGTIIEPGIYKANMGETGEYESITLNLGY